MSGRNLSQIQKTDVAVKDSIYHALWKDVVLRAIEFDEIDVHVKNSIVYLHGHIVNTSSRSRIENAVRTVPGILGIENKLILDDWLTLEVAISLGGLEHTYGCKFFTGVSHGTVSLNGIVSDETVKLLAEQCAAGNPNVRGVINNVRVMGSQPEAQVEPFLQPTIGEIIYFLDGISGVVKQVIINPDNRRVMAMIVQGEFMGQQYEHNSTANDKAQPSEQLIVVPMNVVRYMTRVSGFLDIKHNERNRFLDFEPASFGSPGGDWIPPYPYCSNDVLFPVEQQALKEMLVQELSQPAISVASQEQLLWEQLLANDSSGG